MDDHVDRGRRYEVAAERFLSGLGYEVLGRNVRFGRKEVDLVVSREGIVAFVEVKGRRDCEAGHPLAAITPAKQREIEAVARWWVRSHPPAVGYRFDAVSVLAPSRDPSTWRIAHTPDAWRPGLA